MRKGKEKRRGEEGGERGNGETGLDKAETKGGAAMGTDCGEKKKGSRSVGLCCWKTSTDQVYPS